MSDYRLVCLDGNIINETDAMIAAVQSGLFYGAGCFETMLYENGFIFRYDEHIERMYAALRYLGLADDLFPDKRKTMQHIDNLIHQCNFDHQRIRVRIQVSLIEKQGYYYDDQVKTVKLITAAPAEKHIEPAALVQAKTRVVPDICCPAHLKLSNMLHYRNAFRKAVREGADDAIMLTTNGFIAEAATANIFWKTGDTVYTPSGLCDILPGILRQAVIDIIENDGSFTIKEGKFYSTVLFNAESVWLTNSLIEIRAVKSIDGATLPIDEPFMNYLNEKLKKLKEHG
jgi:branched-subunit amino acid aminotransferase/4-amino-4-deoxychorismate lyase